MTKKCNICNGSLNVEPKLVITTRDRFEMAINSSDNPDFKRTWNECSNCSVIQTIHFEDNEKLLESISGSYYEIDFGDLKPGFRYNRIMSLDNQSSDNYHRVKRILDFYRQWNNGGSSEPKILDIGGGLGVFLSKFIEMASEFTGVLIEPDEMSTSHLDDTYPFKVYREFFYGQEKFQNEYEIVTLNKVVEHLKNPKELISDISKVLGPKGILYLEIPDDLNLVYKPSTDNSLGSLHHNLYNYKSLEHLITSCGYFPLLMERIKEPSGKISIYAFAIHDSKIDDWLVKTKD
jgi:SAM-dependent methyltransferase